MTSTQDKEHHSVPSPDEVRDSEHSESPMTTPSSKSNKPASLLTLPSELRMKILRYLLCLDNTREQSYTAGECSVLGFRDTCCKFVHTPEPDFEKPVFEPKQMMETSYHIETAVTTSCRQLASEGNRILYFENVFAVIAGLAEEDLFLLSVEGVTCQFTMSSPEYRRKFLEPPRADDIETRRISPIVIGMHLGAERSNDVLLVPMTELHLALDVCRQIASGCNAYRTKGGMYKSRYGKVGISLSSCMKVLEIYHLPAHEVQVFWRQEFVSWFGTQLSPLAVDFRSTSMWTYNEAAFDEDPLRKDIDDAQTEPFEVRMRQRAHALVDRVRRIQEHMQSGVSSKLEVMKAFMFVVRQAGYTIWTLDHTPAEQWTSSLRNEIEQAVAGASWHVAFLDLRFEHGLNKDAKAFVLQHQFFHAFLAQAINERRVRDRTWDVHILLRLASLSDDMQQYDEAKEYLLKAVSAWTLDGGMSDSSSKEVEKAVDYAKSSGVWVEQDGYAETLNAWLNFARVGSRPNVSVGHHIQALESM